MVVKIDSPEQFYSFSKPSETVQIHLPDARTISGPRSTPVRGFLSLLEEESEACIVGAIVNGTLRELTYPIEVESFVTPVTMAMEDGMRIYRRSLTFLLEIAFSELYPGADLTIDHSVSSGGYFCQTRGCDPLTEKTLAQLEEKMRQFVEADIPFVREKVPLRTAIEYYEKQGKRDKVRLLSHRKKDYLVLYKFGDYWEYHHGYMVPSSGYVKWFKLDATGGGFTLRFPRRSHPNEIEPLRDYPKLLATFRRYGDWLENLGIDSVGALNDAIQEKGIREVVLVAEALHEQRIAEIATQVAARRDQVRVVLISGPSASGKTTASKRIAVQLLTFGLSPFPLELDNFFVDRDKTPLDENGEKNFEHIDAINRERLNHDLARMIDGEKVRLPHYNFEAGKSEEGEEIQLGKEHVIVIEGIHGLDPKLLPQIPEERTFRIYISALTQLNLDHHNRVSTTDTRLLRRIVRDVRDRGYSPQLTIQRWGSVQRGEKSYIFPYQENADIMFNSALVYELAALKPFAEPLLRQIPYGTPEHIEVKRLLALLEWFLPVDPELIPDNSLLREFIGGSILREFKLWKNGDH